MRELGDEPLQVVGDSQSPVVEEIQAPVGEELPGYENVVRARQPEAAPESNLPNRRTR